MLNIYHIICIFIITIVINHSQTCYKFSNNKKDPCEKLNCTFGADCKRIKDGKSAQCQCPYKCYNYGDSIGSRAVCGSDGRDYANECELRKNSCHLSKNIFVKFQGKCDPCHSVQCPTSQICQLDENRNPICRCNAICADVVSPICGSDGKTYLNECKLRVEACKERKSLRILHNGECGSGKGPNPCESLKCSLYQECEIDRYGIASCVCPQPCLMIMNPVCGSDGKTYDSECNLRHEACVNQQNVTLVYKGICGEDGACNGFTCEFGSICQIKSTDSQPVCECPVCADIYEPVCGSDGITYGNKCSLQREACEQQKVIEIKSEGVCDGCEKLECKHHSVCQVDTNHKGKCVCPNKCSHLKSPICGSDGVSYPNECELRLASCLKKEDILIASKGPCDICQDVFCKYGAKCVAGDCVCPDVCPLNFEPVCASDGNTYVNECQMRVQACQQSVELEINFYGECQGRKAPETVVGSGIGYIKTCDHNTCRFGGVCDYDVEGIPHCICSYHCPSGGPEEETVCGSDGRLYENECKLQEEACRRQQEIQPAISRLCEDSKLLPCDGNAPLIDSSTGREYDCGIGRDAKQCPSNSYCHRSSRFAKCCREVSSIRSCSESIYGCCPDGVTSSQGPEFAGCPSVCKCNKLGSYSAICDPKSRQCHCKVGVGGLTCDRCEQGFWGLHKISEGNSGCIPCACNMNGSVRDDCDQMTGRCVCKHGLQGIKCNVCPDEMVLDDYGCIHVSLKRFYSGSCSGMNCRFGATCVENMEKGIQCVCSMKCPVLKANPTDVVATSRVICASDGNTYLSECQMKFFSCRMQRKLIMVHKGKCRSSEGKKGLDESVTQGPVKRSTIYKSSHQPASVLSKELTLSHSDITSSQTTSAPNLSGIIQTPAFVASSYIELPRLQAHNQLSIELEFTAHVDSGLLLYNGQTASGDGDFVSLGLKKGYVEFRFDLGSGKVKLNSTQPVPNGKKVKIVAKRYHRDGTLTVDGQPDVTGSSGGDLKSLDLAEHLFVGSIPNISPKISENIGFVDGFIGCIHKLQIGNQKIDLSSPQSKDVIKIHNVQDCKLAPCTINRCLNGGTCHPGTSFTSFVCSCPKYYTGSYCQIKSEVCARANPCIKGTTCTLLPLGGFSCQCNNGKSEKLCIETPREAGSLITAFTGSSYLALPTVQNIAQAFVIEIWFLSKYENGLLLYTAQDSPNERRDFLSINLVNRYVRVSFNLGSTLPNITGATTISTQNQIEVNKWHQIRVTRHLRKATLQLDEGPTEIRESSGDLNELNLNQPVYIASLPSTITYTKHASPYTPFNGAIQRIAINGEIIDDLLKKAIEIKSLDEYRGHPCDANNLCLNTTLCIPHLNDYFCR